MIVASAQLRQYGRALGGTGLLWRWIILIALTASFLAVSVAPPSAVAASNDPCPMAAMMTADSGAPAPCCDPDGDNGLACKSGMSCQAAATVLPVQLPVAFVETGQGADHFDAARPAMSSRFAERTLRPPIYV